LQSRLIAKITGLTLAACHNVRQGHSPLRLAEFSFQFSFQFSFCPAFGPLLSGN